MKKIKKRLQKQATVTTSTKDGQDVSTNEESSSSSQQQQTPSVTIPSIPDSSRLSKKKLDTSVIKASELIPYAVTLCQNLIENHHFDSNSPIVEKLSLLAKELDTFQQQPPFKKISFDGDLQESDVMGDDDDEDQNSNLVSYQDDTMIELMKRIKKSYSLKNKVSVITKY